LSRASRAIVARFNTKSTGSRSTGEPVGERLTKRSAMVSGQSGARGGDRRLSAARRGRLPDGHRLVASWGVHQNWRKSAATCLIRVRPAPSGSSRPPERTTGAEPEPWPPDDRMSLNRTPLRRECARHEGRALWAGGPMLAWGPRTRHPVRLQTSPGPGDRRGTPASGPLARLAAPGLEPVFAVARVHSASRSRNAERTHRTAAAIPGRAIRPDGSLTTSRIARHSIHHENRIHRIARSCCWHPHVTARQNDKIFCRHS
jgi:hypothetical protein